MSVKTKKVKLFTMKVEADELEKWHIFAKSKKAHLSHIIKKLMRGEELPETLPAKKEQKRVYSKVDPKLIREINAIGNNLNQLSRRVNERQQVLQLTALSDIEQQLKRVLDAHNI